MHKEKTYHLPRLCVYMAATSFSVPLVQGQWPCTQLTPNVNSPGPQWTHRGLGQRGETANSLDSPLTEENGRQGYPEIAKQRKTSWPWRGVGLNVPYEPPGVGVWWQMPPICCSKGLNWSIFGGRNCPVLVCSQFLEQTHKLAHPISSYNSFLSFVLIMAYTSKSVYRFVLNAECICEMTKCSFVTFYIMCRIRSLRKVPRYPICTICVSLSISPSPSVCLSVFLPIFICFLTTAYLFLRVSVRWVRSPCIFVLFVKTLEEALWVVPGAISIFAPLLSRNAFSSLQGDKVQALTRVPLPLPSI